MSALQASRSPRLQAEIELQAREQGISSIRKRHFVTPAVLIFRDELVQPWETFIPAQAEALRSFLPYYIGSKQVDGATLPRDRTLMIGGPGLIGRAREACFKLWGLAPEAVHRCRKLHPVLTHAHFGTNGALALPLVHRLRIPLIVTYHGFDATQKDEYGCRTSYVFRTYVRRREWLKRETRQFIAVSNFIKRKLLEKGFPEEKLLVHYIGIDVDLFQPDPAVQRESIVLFVGRLVENKGCEYLIRAMQIVQQRIPEARTVIIGDGPLRHKLEQMTVSRLRNCSFLGLQPPAEVRRWMNRAKVFSVPSVTIDSGASEGFGLVFAEAQAMGLPVAGFATGGIPEAVADGKTGFLVPERAWELLADRILGLLTNEASWRQFSLAGRKRVSSLFNLHHQSRTLEEIYESVLRPPIELRRI